MKKLPSTGRAAQAGGKAAVKSQEPALPGKPENLILLLRGEKVILDAHLAVLYGVTTGNLNKAVKRHRDRFPEDFMFQLTSAEAELLIFQFGISKKGRGGTRKLPYAFTEQGVAMLSSVLNSERAVKVNIEIMRAFVRMRRVLEAHRALAKKLSELEATVGTHDEEIRLILETLRQLMQSPSKPKLPIGFGVKERKGRYAASGKKAKP
jgi:hypothetical protein